MTKGLPGTLCVSSIAIIERAGCGVVSEGGRPTNQQNKKDNLVEFVLKSNEK